MTQRAKVNLSKRAATCPACGGRVEFRLSTSLVSVCEYCNSVVARGDRGVEDHGKLSDLAETASPLKLRAQGKWNGKSLLLIGRAQYRHASGAVWDEWYVALANGKWGWLAEAQGKFYLTFHRSISAESTLPAYDDLFPGQTLQLDTLGTFTVNETSTATLYSADGELPFVPKNVAAHQAADLSGENGVFATLDYSSAEPQVFIGNEITLDQLEIKGLSREAVDRAVTGQQLNCPQCGGPLSLHAPDSAERVTCPSCRSYFDVAGSKLEYLATLKPPKPELVIPLGFVGKLKGIDWTVIGYVRRYVTFDKKYYWSEYLLYHPREGYRWLVHSDGHWSFVWSVAPADVRRAKGSRTAYWNGRSFRLFQSKILTVSEVYGEFYWKVAAGDEVKGDDLISPPYMISMETTDPQLKGADSKELSVSIGEYLPHEELERGFGLSNLRRGWGVAPNQPCPVDNQVFMHWAMFVLVILGIWTVVSPFKKAGVDTALLIWALILISILPICAILYKWSFDQSRWKDSEFNPYPTSSGDDD